MTDPRFKTVGRAKGEWRLEVEGWPEQFVSSLSMIGTLADTRIRRLGLDVSDVVLGDESHPPDGTLDGDSVQAILVDIAEYITASLTTEPTVTQWLTASVVPADTNFPVVDSTPFVTNNHYHIGTEVVKVTAKPTGTSLTVTRAQWGTTAQYHYASLAGDLQYAELTDRPVLMTGRRAYLAWHSPQELTTASTGTQVWLGIVETEPDQDDAEAWAISIRSIASLFDQEVGADFDRPLVLSGIYYPYSAPLVFRLTERSGTGWASSGTSFATVVCTGHWATQVEFCAALQALVTTATAGWNNVYLVEPLGEDDWRLTVRTHATTPKYAEAIGGSLIDGYFGFRLFNVGDGAEADTVAANTAYGFAWDPTIPGQPSGALPSDHPRLRAVPRAQYQAPPIDWIQAAMDVSLATTWPFNRIYLDRSDLLVAGDAITIGESGPMDISATSPSDGYVEFQVDGWPIQLYQTFLGPECLWIVTAVRNYGTGTLKDFINALISAGTKANAGGTPYTVAADWGDLSAITNAAAGRPWVTRRKFVFQKPVRLGDLVAEECKLAGVFPAIDSVGRITFVRIGIATTGEIGSYDLGDTQSESRDPGRVSLAADGIINVAEIQDGYSSHDETWSGEMFSVKHCRSISRVHVRRTVEIRPKSESELILTSYPDAVTVAWPTLVIYGGRYGVVTKRISPTSWGIVAGSTVRLTLPNVPWRGVRGLVVEPGVVLGKRWTLRDMEGEIKVLIHGLDIGAGYTPTARVLSQIDLTNNTWQLTVGNPAGGDTLYAPDGATDASKFVVDHKVQVHKWDSATGDAVTGTVTLVGSNKVTVHFDGVWTPGASTWNLMFRLHSGCSVAQQVKWPFVANSSAAYSDGRIARVYAP